MKVLLVDDEDDLLELMQLSLEQSGIEAVPTNSPLKAIELIKERMFDVVISDYHLMQEMNGRKLFEEVNGGLLKGIPFIIFTGRDIEGLNTEPVNGTEIFYIYKGQKGDPFSEMILLIKKIMGEPVYR